MIPSLTSLVESSIMTDATVRLARHLAYLYSEDDETVIIATACVLTVLSAGSICFDLERACDLQPESTSVQAAPETDPPLGRSVDDETEPLPGSPAADKLAVHDTRGVPHDGPEDEPAIQWPDATTWADVLSRSPMVSTDPTRHDRPLVLDDHRLYLTRYWQEQEQIATWLMDHVRRPPVMTKSDTILSLLFADSRPDQRKAAQLALNSMVSVVAGGPGTGKTTVVARLLAALGH
ncbi:MAG: AAA family ATPase, partial [Propionibacteriaceae bacterium]|nr:AAA family ATPase [Propionibacteriaceae bacterium]